MSRRRASSGNFGEKGRYVGGVVVREADEAAFANARAGRQLASRRIESEYSTVSIGKQAASAIRCV